MTIPTESYGPAPPTNIPLIGQVRRIGPSLAPLKPTVPKPELTSAFAVEAESRTQLEAMLLQIWAAAGRAATGSESRHGQRRGQETLRHRSHCRFSSLDVAGAAGPFNEVIGTRRRKPTESLIDR